MLNLGNYLNSEQVKACEAVNGPIMVIAGAGSGKTRVLTYRVAYLISEVGIVPSSILAITFTNKAALEIKERLNNLIGTHSKYVWCSTFHATCARILRREIEIIGIKKDFQIIDEDDSLSIIRQVMKELFIDPKIYQPSKFQDMISRVKSGMSQLGGFVEPIKSMLNRVYHAYNDKLRENNQLDFDDLIVYTLEIFKKYPDILEKYQDIFNYILVDEFQDTSNQQYELVYLLAKKHRNLFIVGDEDQSIYSFRGANINNIKKYMKDFPEYKKIVLSQNYRSTKNILSLSNGLISHNVDRIPKDLWSANPTGDKIEYSVYEEDRIEAFSIIKEIKNLVRQDYEYKDIAILYRNNYLSRLIEDELMKAKIPYQIYSGLSFYRRKEVKDMIAYFRLIIDFEDELSFKRVVNVPRRGIGDTTINKLFDYKKENKLTIAEAIDKIDTINDSSKTKLKKFYNLITYISSQTEEFELKEFYDYVLNETGYHEYLKEDKDTYEDRIGNVQELENNLVSFLEYEVEGDTNFETISIFLQNVSLKTDLDVNDVDDNHVSLMTMHTAKGLEFRVVFLIALEHEIIPGNKAIKPSEIEEERRILYVATTRAKEKLYLSNSSTRFMYGRKESQIPSPFVFEMDKKYLNIHEYIKEKIETPKYVIKTDTSKSSGLYKVGDKINHKVFGKGVIVAVNLPIITVAFSKEYGIKKLMYNHPAIIKEDLDSDLVSWEHV